ncbi:S46 family peptidase [Planobacterium oryzisoli]|uniref:Dipeptidyl-peptidase n=1 Tax=Planobacterium oryzisoli TaxID=2771435 RepID=A0A931E8H4_9FLAO|nr:S46 family peptidase [Planobacterium oryzisoli]MBF5026932.1 S46 family peptidase [Planobacterium oryzisoli]
MKRLLLLCTFLLSFIQMRADEGMWLMMLVKRLNGQDLQKKGLKLTAEEIYSVNQSSLKDAIVQFGGGCTAEMVSKEGLLFTNHHCGYGQIAALSTPEKDHLTNGFWAMKKSEELPAKGLSVRFLVRMDDVTQRINSKLNNAMSAKERRDIIEAESKLIQQENSENGKYVVTVRDFYNGNEFYYFVYQDYKDVRLVGTPPNSIGKFGGDTDNWEWPRHTGDFSVFRVYSDANGNPAEYSPNNVPLKPKHHLPVSLKPFKPGDFSMIVGYPGRTNRYMTSYGIDQLVNKDYPAWVEASKTAMDVMKWYMDKDQATKLNYASQYASVANYWKNRAGTIESVNKNGTIQDKQKVEEVYQQWAEKEANRELYGNVLSDMKDYYAQTSARGIERNYAAQMTRNAKYIPYAINLSSMFKSYMAESDAAKKAELKKTIASRISSMYEKFNPALEQQMLKAMVSLYAQKVPAAAYAPSLYTINPALLDDVAKNSIFATEASAMAFLNNPDAEKLSRDALLKIANNYATDSRQAADKYVELDDKFSVSNRLFFDGLRKSHPNKEFYPDANSTMRITFGKISTLPFRDDRNYHGVTNNFYTDLDGTVAKYKKGDEEFDLPQRLIDLNAKRDYGQYADPAGYLPVNFLSDHDITGGNSGSPIMNGNGELIGLAFDGNSEALSGDIVFEEEWQKTINVDARYVLWVIDKFAGAGHLVEEMTIVK